VEYLILLSGLCTEIEVKMCVMPLKLHKLDTILQRYSDIRHDDCPDYKSLTIITNVIIDINYQFFCKKTFFIAI